MDEDRAKSLSAAWAGDTYVTYEQKETKHLLLVTRFRLADTETALRFFGQYSEALEKKHADRTNLFRQPNLFSFSTPEGGVFLRCVAKECITMEGGDAKRFSLWSTSLGWPATKDNPKSPAAGVATTRAAFSGGNEITAR